MEEKILREGTTLPRTSPMEGGRLKEHKERRKERDGEKYSGDGAKVEDQLL